jgi:hypothetical protein
MMACASGVWRAIRSSVISSDMPFMLGKSRRVARPIPKNLTPGRGRLPLFNRDADSRVGTANAAGLHAS